MSGKIELSDQIKREVPTIGKALDVWLKFDPEDPEDEVPTHEANTFERDGYFDIEWYLNAVGQVTVVRCRTMDDARRWYEDNGFADYSA